MTKRKRLNWKELVAEHELSGKSVRAFCGEKGIAANSFYVNRKKLKIQDFVQIGVSKEEVRKEPIILTYRGLRIEIKPGFCKKTLHEVLSVVGDVE